MPLLPPMSPSTAVRAALVVTAAVRIARGRRRAPALTPPSPGPTPDVTVIVPARDEAERIEACVTSLLAQGADVLVIDDGSTDDTRGVAEAAGARVVDAGPLPAGRAGKAHALQVGLEAATTGTVIAVDADTRADPGFVAALVAARQGRTMVSAAARVETEDAAGRAVHASMLASLLYRFGPPGADPGGTDRILANGQCMVFDRAAVLEAGGFDAVGASLIEDVALARHLVGNGQRVAFVDATPLVRVTGYGSAVRTMRGWGRSLALAEVTSGPWLLADLAVVWGAMALPLPRLVAGRGDAIDLAALALRLAVVVVTRPAFRPAGLPLLAAPLFDPAVAAVLTVGVLRPSRRWRGRVYG